MRPRTGWALAAASGIVALVLWVTMRGGGRTAGDRPVTEPSSARTFEPPRAAAPGHGPPVGSERGPASPPLDPERAARMREALRRLFAHAYDAGRPSPGREPAPSPRTMPAPDPQREDQVGTELGRFLADRVRRDFLPLATQCYEAALERDPKLEGTATFAFTIVGDETIGSVVEEASLDESSELTDPEFRECVVQSMMSLTFEAPPKGTEKITVRYPMRFAP